MKRIKIGLCFFLAYSIATISYCLLLTSCASSSEPPKMESYIGTLSASTRGFCHQTVPCWTVTIVGNGAPTSIIVYIGDGKKWERNVTAWGIENNSHVNIYDMDPSIVGYSYQVLITR